MKNEKNLLIDNEAYAKEILKQTSYYSLIGGYKDIFKNSTTKKYKDGTRFEDIVELYYFDELLRQLFLRYLIKVENGIKSQVSYYFTEKNGENQKEYLDTSNYNYSGKKNQRDIDRLIKKLEGVCYKINRLSLYKSFTEEIWKCSIVGTYECFNVWKYIKNVYCCFHKIYKSKSAGIINVLMKNKWFPYWQCLLNIEMFVLMEKGCLHIEPQIVFQICQYIEN